MNREAGIVEVVNRILKRIRDSELANELIEKVKKFSETHNPEDDLTSQEVAMIYRGEEYGDEFDMPGNKELDVNWSNHAEYRSELRNVDPSKVNETIRNYAELHPHKHQKVNLTNHGIGKAVVDVDTTSEPEEAAVVTVIASWSSEKAVRYALSVFDRNLNLTIEFLPADELSLKSIRDAGWMSFDIKSGPSFHVPDIHVVPRKDNSGRYSMSSDGVNRLQAHYLRKEMFELSREDDMEMRKIASGNDTKKMVMDRLSQVKSEKVKKYVHEGLVKKIDQAGEAAPIWLETLASHFNQLKAKDLMEGFKKSDFDDLYFVITGDKASKKAADALLMPGAGDGNDDEDKTHHYKLGSVKTFAQIQDEGGEESHHHWRLHCVECNAINTCRCSQPKVDADGLCYDCCEKAGIDFKTGQPKAQQCQIVMPIRVDRIAKRVARSFCRTY